MRYALPFIALGALLFSFAAVPAQSQQAAPSPQTSLHDAAVELGRRYDNFYGKKDVAGMVSLYASDGELVSPGGKIIVGRQALAIYYRARFASGATGHKITVLETHALGDAGYSVADFSVSVPSTGHPSENHTERGHIAAVYTHDSTGWHLALVEPSVMPGKGG